MKLATTYICVKDMEKSITFYTDLLQMKPTFQNQDRWVEFACGNTIALYNRAYDEVVMTKNEGKQHFNEAYVTAFSLEEEALKNDLVILNFVCKDIKEERERLHRCGYSTSEIMYVNFFHPYYYFTILDPDGNELEIAEEFKE